MLYISDLIKLPTCKDPGYGKLHIGIYVTAIQDTMDWEEQQLRTKSQSQLPNNDKDDRDNFCTSRGDHKGGQGGWGSDRGGSSNSSKQEQVGSSRCGRERRGGSKMGVGGRSPE